MPKPHDQIVILQDPHDALDFIRRHDPSNLCFVTLKRVGGIDPFSTVSEKIENRDRQRAKFVHAGNFNIRSSGPEG